MSETGSPNPRLVPYPAGPYYDVLSRPLEVFRRQVVELLDPDPGEVVLDAGCGSGLCFPFLEAKIGPEGRILAVDQCPQMLEQAGRTVKHHGWTNVTLVASPLEDLDLGEQAGAALLCAGHDILRSPRALAGLFRNLRPGARLAAVGPKVGPPWMFGLNLLVMLGSAPFVRTLTGFERPWSHLERFVDGLKVTELGFGTGYLLLARARAALP